MSNGKKEQPQSSDSSMAIGVILVVLAGAATVGGVRWESWKETGLTALATLGVVLGPIVGLAMLVWTWAWWSGWGPLRVRRIAVGSWVLALYGVWAAWPLATVPGRLYADLGHRAWGAALVLIAPFLVPLGVTLGAIEWARTWRRALDGRIQDPRRAGRWAHRQFAHAMRRARREAKRPGLVPVLTRRGEPVLGRVGVVTEGAATANIVPRDPRHLVVPLDQVRKHLLIVGEPGVGKTVMLLRLQRGWLEGAWLRHMKGGGDRPLLIFVDCKGGRDGTTTAKQFRAMCQAMGIVPGRIGEWPNQVRLDLWSLPTERLIEVLQELLAATHEFYDAMKDELVALAVLAPGGPPTSSVDFVGRLNSRWLMQAWGPEYPGERESIKENAKHFAGIASRYRSLFRKLGRSVDAGRHLGDFDAVICTIEGTQNERTASAMAQAVVELVTDLATRGGPDGKNRQVLFPIDEFSAVSAKVTVSKLMERFRSLGVAVIPIAQSWTSLGEKEDDRKRIRDAAAGGLLVMSTSDPEALAAAAGTGIVVESGTKRLEQGGWGDEGTGRAQRSYVVDPDWVRALGRFPGQVVYIDHGVATWGVVAPADLDEQSFGLPSALHAAIRSAWRPVIGPRVPVAELEAGLTRLETLAAGGEEPASLADSGDESVREERR
jgi:hypothetical protein